MPLRSVPMSTTVTPAKSYAPPAISPWWVRLPVLFACGLILFLLLTTTLLIGWNTQYRQVIYPNIVVAGTPLGGLTRDEARATLASAFTKQSDTVFTFRDGENFWQFSAADLGMTVDLEATLDRAFTIGHSGSVVSDIMTQLRLQMRGVSLSPIITYDQQVAIDQLLTISATINRAAANASLVMNSSALQTSEGSNGRALDITQTLAALEPALLAMQRGGEIPLTITETLPIVRSVADTSQQIQTALSAPITLIVADEPTLGPWTASTEQLAQLLRLDAVTNPDGTQSYVAHIDGAAFEASLETLAPGLIAPAQNARFHFNEATAQLEVIQPAISGRRLDVAETVRRLEEAVFSTDQRTVPLAFDLTLAPFHNQVSAQELGIREVVAEATTLFSGSPQNRRTNIAVSASKFDGIIIAPGEEFSFNYYLGDISDEGGFVEAKVIVGDRTVIGIGGGVCQVSTTLFRAAFSGGFAITERNSHGYRVGFYEQGGAPPGLDAAIYQPERDFKFQNNTPYHVLIQTSVYPNSDALQFKFYSTRTFNTEVEPAIVKNVTAASATRYEANTTLSAGESLQVDYSAEGADVTVYRKVYDLQGNLVMDDYVFTHYLSWGAIFQVAPGDSRLGSS